VTIFRDRTLCFWTGAGFLAAAVLGLTASLLVGDHARGPAAALFLAALGARFASYELQDPGFSRARVLVLGGLLVAILLISLRIPAKTAIAVDVIGALLVAGGTAGDVWGLWRKRRVAG
jgi:hypothetical protein